MSIIKRLKYTPCQTCGGKGWYVVNIHAGKLELDPEYESRICMTCMGKAYTRGYELSIRKDKQRE